MGRNKSIVVGAAGAHHSRKSIQPQCGVSTALESGAIAVSALTNPHYLAAIAHHFAWPLTNETNLLSQRIRPQCTFNNLEIDQTRINGCNRITPQFPNPKRRNTDIFGPK